MTDHEEGLVAGDHPLQHGDDGSALLGPRRTLDAELLVGVLLLVEQVWAEDGCQVQGCHLVPCDLYLEKEFDDVTQMSSSPCFSKIVSVAPKFALHLLNSCSTFLDISGTVFLPYKENVSSPLASIQPVAPHFCFCHFVTRGLLTVKVSARMTGDSVSTRLG